jgi:hypothetical protein
MTGPLCRDSQGSVGFEVLPFLTLLFVIGALALLHGWAVIDAKLAANAAARETTRALVEMPVGTPPDQALHIALLHGRAATGDQHDIAIEVVVTRPDPSTCVRVTVTATRTLELPPLPFLDLPGRQTVRSTYSELLDPYRDGQPRRSACPA